MMTMYYASVVLLNFLEYEYKIFWLSFFLNPKILLAIWSRFKKITVCDRNLNISDAQYLHSTRVLGMLVC